MLAPPSSNQCGPHYSLGDESSDSSNFRRMDFLQNVFSSRREEAPIIMDEQDSPLLCIYIFDKFSEESQHNVSKWKKAPLAISSAIAIVCGYISWYPIAKGVLKVGNNQFYKVIFFAGSWSSYGSLYAWGTIQITYDLFKRCSRIESELTKRKTKPILSLAYKGTICLAGLGATLPNAYFAYIFNKQSAMWTGINIAGSWGLCAYSVHNMITEFQLPRWKYLEIFYSEAYLKRVMWNEVREFLIGKLNGFAEKIPITRIEDIVHVIHLSKSDQGHSEAKELSKDIFEKIFQIFSKQAETANAENFIETRPYIRYSVKLISSVLPIANIYCNAKAAWDLASRITSWLSMKSILTGIALLPSYLQYSLTRDFLFSAVKLVYNLIYKKPTTSLAEICLPEARKIALTIAFTLAYLSNGINFATAREIFSDDSALDYAGITESMTNSSALIIIPAYELSSALIDLYIHYRGSSDAKFKLDNIVKVNELISCIRNCSQEHFIAFVGVLMESDIIANELNERFDWLKEFKKKMSNLHGGIDII